MNGPVVATEVLGAMITPAVLISASGTLVLSTSNRLTRVVDRVRVLADEVEELYEGAAGRGSLSLATVVKPLATGPHTCSTAGRRCSAW